MPATESIRVEGLAELDRALKSVSKDMQKGLREELAVVAEPVRVDAERLATSRIRNIGPMRAKSWANMRVSQTRGAVYVAPKRRGRNKNAQLRRPRFAGVLIDKAMDPALAQNETKIVERLEFLLNIVIERNGF